MTQSFAPTVNSMQLCQRCVCVLWRYVCDHLSSSSQPICFVGIIPGKKAAQRGYHTDAHSPTHGPPLLLSYLFWCVLGLVCAGMWKCLPFEQARDLKVPFFCDVGVAMPGAFLHQCGCVRAWLHQGAWLQAPPMLKALLMAMALQGFRQGSFWRCEVLKWCLWISGLHDFAQISRGNVASPCHKWPP